ncbi:MAG TPA: serine hydrolase domain-containing protein [Methylomirabilota bacterium]|nr:serine hydrolase domain-containing protein [Methylomirabilota bacterium]
MLTIDGHCEPRFTAVREEFFRNFTERGDVGASVCVYVDGVRVVDCWGGHADAARSRPFGADTLVSVASTTKGMVALCAHMLAERGKLDLDAPVARSWPEFAAAGKQDIPVRWLLSHRAGLPAIRRPLPAEALFDWRTMTEALAETPPWWTPGERHGYHAMTFGHLVGEVIRRVDGRSVGAFLRDEVTGPLRADFFIGVPAEMDGRAAEVLAPPPPAAGETTLWDTLLADPASLSGRTFLNPPRPEGLVNTRAWRAAEIPAANGHTSARGVARVYAALARGGELDSVRLLAPATIERAIAEQSKGRDEVLTLPTRFASGFMLGMPGGIFHCGPGRRTFGHPGHGGSIGFADPDARVGFGYVTNQYLTDTLRHPDRRVRSLVDAVYAALR